MRARILACLGLCVALITAAAHGARARAAGSPHRLVVKLHAEGEHAVLDCAMRLERQGRAFATATRDGSPSMDLLRERFGVHGTRPLFRSADGRSLDAQRGSLRERLAGSAGSHRAGGPRASGAHQAPAPLPDLAHVYTLEIADDASPEEAARAFAADPHVAWAQVDGLNDLDADPYLDGEGSWGQPYADLWGLLRVRADLAWPLSRGEGVVVAVVDTGLDYLHPDIADNVFVNPGEDLDGNGRVDPADWNGVDDDGNGFIDDLRGFDFAGSVDANRDGDYDDPGDVSDPDPWDDNGHGTHVAGTIAAVEGNGIGIAGVAPGARIMPLKGFPAEGPAPDSVLWRAVLYAVENGARVVNTSWSCRGRCPDNPLAEEMAAVVHALGGVVVTSAGNDQDDAAFKSPENAYETITVASSGEDDGLSRSFSNDGLVVDVAAPGGDPSVLGGPFIVSSHKNILSLRATDATASDALTVGGRYVRNAGTSMAAPHVSGVVALMLARDPDLPYATIKTALRLGAADLGAPGHDATFGAGRLDAPEALAAVDRADAEVALTAPRPMTLLDPLAGPHAIRGRIAGRHIESVTAAFGAGLAPTSWTPLEPAQETRGDDGRDGDAPIAWWDTRGLADGAYTVRLRARLRSGEDVDAYLPLELERHPVRRISAVPGSRPVVGRSLVVYEALDRQTAELDLRIADARTGTDRVLVATEGDQRSADLDGRLLAWVDGPRADRTAPVRACWLRGPSGERCDPVTVADSPALREAPAVGGGRLYWGEQVAGDTELLRCRMEPSGADCAPEVFQSGPGSQRSPGVAGRTVAWLSSAAGQLRTEFCTLDPRTGACPARPVGFDRFVFTAPAVGDRLLAWEEFGFLGGEVWLCALDPATGACPPVRIAERALDAHPRLSGRRLVFAADDATGNRDVWLCEHDPVLERCPVQRLTGSATSQTRPDIDGDLVVWQDDRLGEPHVFSLRLPTLRPIGTRHVRAGQLLVVPLRARHTGQPHPEIEAALADGRALDAIGAELMARPGGGRATLRWRPGRDQVGRHLVTITARSATGLVSQETIGIEVVPAPDRHRAGSGTQSPFGRWWSRTWRGWWGSGLTGSPSAR